MGGVSSAIDVVQKATTFGMGVVRERRLDYVTGQDSSSDKSLNNCLCCNLNTNFTLDLATHAQNEDVDSTAPVEDIGSTLTDDVDDITTLVQSREGSDASLDVFSHKNVMTLILGNLKFEDLLHLRRVNKILNKAVCNCLRCRRSHETVLDSERRVSTFLKILKNVGCCHPFGDLVIDLWEISLETVLDLSRDLWWVTGLKLFGTASTSAQPPLRQFILKDISTKVAVLLNGTSNIESLWIKTDFEISITGILELLLSKQFPKLSCLMLNTIYAGDSNFGGGFLENVMRRSPNLTSLGLILPENGDDKFLEALIPTFGIQKTPSALNISLATPLSLSNVETLLRKSITLTSLRIRISEFGNEQLREHFHLWLSSQSQSLVAFALALETDITFSGTWNLPALAQLEVLSILITGTPSSVIQPFDSGQFPKLSSFAYVHSGGNLDLFNFGVYRNVKSIGISGKNGPLDPNIAEHLPNLQHFTLCGVSRQHLTTILSKFTSLLELVLIFEEGESDLWREVTGEYPECWEDLFQEVFGNVEVNATLEAEVNDLLNAEVNDLAADLHTREANDLDLLSPEVNDFAVDLFTLEVNDLDLFPPEVNDLIVDLLAPEVNDSLDAEWNAIMECNAEPSDACAEVENSIFQESLEGLEETIKVVYGLGDAPLPSFANMKCLEYLKIMGWNASALGGLIHMSSNQKLSPLGHFQIELPPNCQLPPGSLELLKSYHKTVLLQP